MNHATRLCGCGCGELVVTSSGRGRPRVYVSRAHADRAARIRDGKPPRAPKPAPPPKAPKVLRPCGTLAAYNRHRSHGETPCDACSEAARAWRRAYRKAKGQSRPTVQPCGTPAAYRRHRKRGEEACEPCKAAEAARAKARYRRRSPRKPPRPRPLKPCGTNAAYQRHLRKGEQPCQACRDAARARNQARYQADREAILERDKRLQLKHRRKSTALVLAHYSATDPPSCKCCGSRVDLQIDHVNGGGAEHRTELFGRPHAAGDHFYDWLIRNGFPEKYQVLCKPCNDSKGEGVHCQIWHVADTVRFLQDANYRKEL